MAKSGKAKAQGPRGSEEYANATEKARSARELAAREVADVIAGQVRELLVSGDSMGGRGRVAVCLENIVVAERRGDLAALRAATIDLAVAGAAWTAALDFETPRLSNGGGAGSAAAM